MANKVVTFLEHVALDLEHGVEKALEYIKPFEPLIEGGLALIPDAAPAVPIFHQVVNAAVLAQQAYQAPGSGPKRLASVLGVLGPTIESYLGTKDANKVKGYIDGIVALLNLAPAAV